jgi:3-deoxy-D-manno-octulosonic-acid transferase
VFVLSLPVLGILMILKKRIREGFGQRLGIYGKEILGKLKDRDIHLWIHAASVGEVNLIKKISSFPAENTLITCTTVSGVKIAQQNFPESIAVLLPLDFIFLAKRLKKIAEPDKVIILETELWPGLIHSLKDKRIIIVNARLSDKKFPYYYFFRKYVNKFLEMTDMVYARDEENYKKFMKLGLNENKIKILGDLKNYFEYPVIPDEDKFLKPENPVIVFGSTHSGEETIIIDAFKKLREKFNELAVVISPRHLERLKEVRELLDKNAIGYINWSEKKDSIKPGETILVDTMGQLAAIYSLGNIAFVGGSMVPVGGHNIIEAAVWKIPVIIGSYSNNFKEMVAKYIDSGGVRVANSVDDLYNIFNELLSSREIRKDMGERNYRTCLENKSMIENNMKDVLL